MFNICRRFNGLFCTIIVCASFVLLSTKLSAYVVCGYKLKESLTDGEYYISAEMVTYNGTTVNYANIAENAVDAWNNAIDATSSHSLDIDLEKGIFEYGSNNRVVIYPVDRGATGWRGFTYYYDYNLWVGQPYSINYGGYPDQDYYYGTAVINLYYVHGNPDWKKQNTIMHEMGHIFGLKHSNREGALMIQSSASYTSLQLPQSDDIAGVRAIYS